MWSSQLIDVVERQAEAIRRVLSVVVKQREALKEGRLELLKDLLREMDQAHQDAITAESLRLQVVRKIAESRNCSPTLNDLAASGTSEESEAILEAGEKLRAAVESAQSEMALLNSLVEENRALNEMLISEWRRLGGNQSLSSLDLKG
ncbi:flagellar protein FlgN [Dethiosulfovibrio sp. F2B]|uniref:flagellar export chaperone FlgN n=1 Tax=Dethiosulfovibrio faecalis TaxID=2720018 RepID=UPI001F245218|nr:flagellar export chaperone FlgN [Dethiosulfovibrio faecalis]MCF4152426.1 flagellar protein FlgN [Dethiosulfovibrio faecalis]